MTTQNKNNRPKLQEKIKGKTQKDRPKLKHNMTTQIKMYMTIPRRQHNKACNKVISVHTS